MVSQCTASASPATGLLAVVRARQMTIVDLAAAATAALAPSQGGLAAYSISVDCFAYQPNWCYSNRRQKYYRSFLCSVAPSLYPPIF